jgi:large subunit ribosomal protein L10
MDKVKKTNLELKKEKVLEIAKKIERAKTIVFANYHGLSASQITDLRETIKEEGGELIVAKNTLISRAMSINHLPVTTNQLAGPTATLLAYEDEIAPVKKAAETAKTLGVPKFKFGFFGRDFLDLNAVENLAKILPKEILQAKIVGSLSSPLYGIVGVLSANIRNLISVLSQKAKMAGGD